MSHSLSRPICPQCRATGKKDGKTCPYCGGTGTPPRPSVPATQATPELTYTRIPEPPRIPAPAPRRRWTGVFFIVIFIAGVALGHFAPQFLPVLPAQAAGPAAHCTAPSQSPLRHATPTPATFPLIIRVRRRKNDRTDLVTHWPGDVGTHHDLP